MSQAMSRRRFCQMCGVEVQLRFRHCSTCQLERRAEAERIRRKQNPEAYRLAQQRYKEDNRERIRVAAKARRDEDPDKAREISRRSYRKHAKKAIAATAKWKRENRDRAIQHETRRRARQAAISGKLSADLVNRLMLLQKGLCAFCECRLSPDITHRDHIIPLSKGGKHCDSNIQLLCRTCNCRKHNKDPVRFAQENGRLL